MLLSDWCKENHREDILRRWDPDNELTPEDISYGSPKKVKWICEKKHRWEASPNKMTRRTSSGCPYCAGQKVLVGFNDLQFVFPEIAKEWNYEKNGELNPDQIVAHSNRKVWWLCPRGHEYEAAVSWRTSINRKRNCPYCANKKVLKGFNDLATVCPDVASEWHPSKNGKLRPDEVLSSSTKKCWWLCPKGHTYQASLNNRVHAGKQNTGCPICSGHIVLEGYNDLQTLFPLISKEWHPTKNRGIKPKDIIPGSHKKYWWLCPVGHEYQASPDNRTKNNRTGCPICAQQLQTSFPEQALFYYIRRRFPDTMNRYSHNGKEIDIYIPSIKVGIEYDGYRYHTKDTRRREEEKDIALEKDGIRLIRVKEVESEWHEKRENIIFVRRRDNYEKTIPVIISEIYKRIDCKDIISVDVDRDRNDILSLFYVAKSENSFLKKHPELVEEWDQKKNGKLNMEMFSPGSGIKVWWRCSKEHSYQMSFNDRDKGAGCPVCAGQRILNGFNDLATKFPEIANEWNYEKNRDVTPEKVMPGSQMKVWWTCSAGHSYQATIASRTRMKSGCPYCAGKLAISGKTDLLTRHPWIKDYWDYEKNSGFEPTMMTPYSHKKVGWICGKGHRFDKSISYVTTYHDKYGGFRCPVCDRKGKISVVNIDTGEEYESMEDAARACGLKQGDTISKCCSGQCKRAGGYHWKYRE